MQIPYADPFRGMMAQVVSQQIALFGERLTIIPTVNRPNYGAVVDPAKPSFELFGVFAHGSGEQLRDIRHQYTRGEYDPGVVSRVPTFFLPTAQLVRPVSKGYVIKRHVDLTSWEITKAMPDGANAWTVAHVNQEGRPKPY